MKPGLFFGLKVAGSGWCSGLWKAADMALTLVGVWVGSSRMPDLRRSGKGMRPGGFDMMIDLKVAWKGGAKHAVVAGVNDGGSVYIEVYRGRSSR